MKTKTYNTVGAIQESIIITQILRVRILMKKTGIPRE
jgi:hypothetical protein